MKIIAFYLPQYHRIKENDDWWGEGFTEWTNLKKANPLFLGHYQPRIPKNNYYYDLEKNDVFEWQINLAKQYGVYGFCFYHYWFNGKMLLERPVERYLLDSRLDLPFCISWANEHWTRAWVSQSNKVLIEQKYGDVSEWDKHFYYLLPFFRDSRYITVDKKPLFIIYRPELIPDLNDMLDRWSALANKEGLAGITFAYQHLLYFLDKKRDESRFQYSIEYQPVYAEYLIEKNRNIFLKSIKRLIARFLERYLRTDIKSLRLRALILSNYDHTWETILRMKPNSPKKIPGAFVDWDNTPRKGNKGRVYTGVTPEKFKKYLKEQVIHARDIYKKDMIFIFAWNEWTEGGYLEPDEKNGTAFLEAIKSVLVETDEFPHY